MIKKMCFSCKGLRRCEVYEQNSEASICGRFMYSLRSYRSIVFFCGVFRCTECVYVLRAKQQWDKYRFAAYRPRLPMCVSVWFVSFFLSLRCCVCSVLLLLLLAASRCVRTIWTSSESVSIGVFLFLSFSLSVFSPCISGIFTFCVLFVFRVCVLLSVLCSQRRRRRRRAIELRCVSLALSL